LCLFNDSLNLHSVGWVGNQVWKFLSHADFSQIEVPVEVGPELAVESFSGQAACFEVSKSNSGEDSSGGFKSFSADKVWSCTSSSLEVLVDSKVVSVA